MGKKFSEPKVPPETAPKARSRDPLLFVVSSDRDFLQATLKQFADVPRKYSLYSSMEDLHQALAGMGKIQLAFVLIAERSCQAIDPVMLRQCKLDYPQLNYLVVLGECEQPNSLRLRSIGVQDIILPPFGDVNLTNEINTALPNIPQFKRHPELVKRGFARLDFSIPSDLQYVLGINHMVSLLLKEFGFPPADCRINIPLACDEALTNAIIHGNQSDPHKKVSVQVYVSASRIKIRIKDQGEGFDYRAVADPTQGDNVMRSSGRGVYLIKTIMDGVEYKEGGRVVELEKSNGNGAQSNQAKH